MLDYASEPPVYSLLFLLNIIFDNTTSALLVKGMCLSNNGISLN